MTQQLDEHIASPRFQPAARQSLLPEDDLLNSANAGLVIHRTGQLKYEFRKEGIDFSLDLARLINQFQLGYVSLFFYEEMYGAYNRFHWLIHMKQPNDYQRLLDMVDHDTQMREVSLADRMPEKGGGNWERMFAEASMRESVLVPQHGLALADGGEPADTFQPPARLQTSQPPGVLLHSANAAAIVHRTVQVQYQFREEARHFAADWARQVNDTLAGQATVLLYEETWGLQDRLHLLMHLSSPGGYWEILRLADRDEGMRRVLAEQRVAGPAGGTGESTFLPGTLRDTLLVPYQVAAAGARS